MSDEAAFWAAISAAPADPVPLLVFADWLDERSDPRGEALRWAGNVGKVPVYLNRLLGEPFWHTCGYEANGDDIAGPFLSPALFSCLKHGRIEWGSTSHCTRRYRGLPDAYDDLAAAWVAVARGLAAVP